MRLRGTWFVTNITSASATTFWNSINSPDPILVERRRTMRPLATEVTLRAYKMGIPIVGPTDFTYEPKFDSDGRPSQITRRAGGDRYSKNGRRVIVNI